MRDNAPPFIAGRISSHYVWRSMPRFVSSLLVAIALLLAPLAMIGGADPAHAARPQVASAANCAEEAPGQKHEKRAPGMGVGCAIACAAVPATQPFSAERRPHAAMPPALLGSHLLSGIHPEGETPPPRMHPEI